MMSSDDAMDETNYDGNINIDKDIDIAESMNLMVGRKV